MSPQIGYDSRNGFFRPSLAVCMYAKETTHFYQPYLHGFCFNLVNFEALLRLELMIHLLQSDGVVDGQNCHQCNTSSTEKANNIGNVVDECVVDAAVGDEMVNNIGPNVMEQLWVFSRYINNELEEGRPVSSKSVYPQKFGQQIWTQNVNKHRQPGQSFSGKALPWLSGCVYIPHCPN